MSIFETDRSTVFALCKKVVKDDKDSKNKSVVESTENDENKSIKLYKIKFEQEAKQYFLDTFNLLCKNFKIDDYIYNNADTELIPYKNDYKLGGKELFCIDSFELPDFIIGKMDKADTLENFEPYKNSDTNKDGYKIKFLYVVTKNKYGKLVACFQSFDRYKELATERKKFKYDKDVFVEDNKFSLYVKDKNDAFYFYDEKLGCYKLVFETFSNVHKKIFDLLEYKKEATDYEIKLFKSTDILSIEENYLDEKTKDPKILEYIYRIARNTSLEKTVDEIDSIAKYNGFDDLNIIDGKIVFPKNKKELLKLLNFLDQKIYKGQFDKRTKISNSTRDIS